METNKGLSGGDSDSSGGEEAVALQENESAAAGPVEAAPHWQSFYAAVRDAVAAMRPNGLQRRP